MGLDFGTYIERLKAINMQQLAVECLQSNESFLLDANINQLKHGKTSKGEQIGKYANSGYASEKYAMNSLAGLGNIDLILEGKFSKGIFYKYTNDSLISDSTGKEKEGGMDLLEHFGDDVVGIFMTQELKTDIQPELIRLIMKQISL